MNRDTFSGNGNQSRVDANRSQGYQQYFQHVQDLLEQNRLLINQINQNQWSESPQSLSRNVDLIKELNNNLKRVASLYAHLSNSFTGLVDGSLERTSSAAVGGSSERASSAAIGGFSVAGSSGMLKSNGNKNNTKRFKSG